jgi:hypothetical protein
VGCPIRRSEDPRALAPPLGFSQRATSFIASRYQGIHQMPFSLKLAHAQPQTRAQRALGREQRTEDRGQTKMSEVPTSLLFSVFCDPIPGAGRKPPRLVPWRWHTHAQVQPDGTAGPASRSRLASRCRRSDVKGQMSDGFEPGMDRLARSRDRRSLSSNAIQMTASRCQTSTDAHPRFATSSMSSMPQARTTRPSVL